MAERNLCKHDEWNGGKIITADALEGLRSIGTAAVDACITSPPYFGLRDYGIAGQIGLEASLEDYTEKLVVIFRDVRRTLKDDGTLWVNLGDSYAGSGKGGGDPTIIKRNIGTLGYPQRVKSEMPNKNLLGIPWRIAFALQADGWILRQDIIWQKPNAMPESVKDRCTKSHEYIFLLSKSQRYYFDSDAIREAAIGFDDEPIGGSAGAFGNVQSRKRKGNARTFRGGGAYTEGRSYNNSFQSSRESHGNALNAKGLRNKRSVWTVATKPYPCAHFATFPPDLIRPCVQAGSRPGGTILDPFFGVGTTGMVAIEEGRQYIGIEINPDYGEMAKQRLAQIHL